MRICIVAQTFSPQEEGGAEILARMCAVELSRHHDVFVLSLGMEGDGLAAPGETKREDGIRVIRIAWHNTYLPGPRKPTVGKLGKLAWHLRAAWGATSTSEMQNILIREKVDLIYAHNSARMQPALFEASHALSIPLCLHLHDYALLCPKSSMYRATGNCDEPCMECRVLTSRLKSDGEGVTVISVSEALKNRFLHHGVLDKAQWHVLHNTYVRKSDFPSSFSRRTTPAPGPFTIGFLGALSEEKGIEDLIRAFITLTDRGHDARLLVAGRGRPDYEDHLKAIAGTAPVDFLGFANAQDIYEVTDVIAVPSLWHEPQGMILIEAAIQGIPVIGSSRGGIPEIVDGHHTGWTYDPDDKGALSDLLEKAVTTGKEAWWSAVDQQFAGLCRFAGTSDESRYYERLNDILHTVKANAPRRRSALS